MTDFNRIAHPFILADNRHFTFYIWRYFLSKELIRFLLVPAYAICLLVMFESLVHKPTLWIFFYAIALSLTLIPSPLIEFRYFLIPFFLYRIHLDPEEANVLYHYEWLYYMAINTLVFYLFLMYPFTWKHDDAGFTQRFMW